MNATTIARPAEIPPHAAAKPFDYCHPSPDELAAAIGSRNWVIARRTKYIIERYGDDVVALSPEKYKAAKARAVESRGWARPAEIVIRDLLDYAERFANMNDEPTTGHCQATLDAARDLLEKARIP